MLFCTTSATAAISETVEYIRDIQYLVSMTYSTLNYILNIATFRHFYSCLGNSYGALNVPKTIR